MLLHQFFFEFECSACGSTYKVVRSPGPYIGNAHVSCLVCNCSLPLETDILKYFLVTRGMIKAMPPEKRSDVADAHSLR
jgi:hypothetical protein